MKIAKEIATHITDARGLAVAEFQAGKNYGQIIGLLNQAHAAINARIRTLQQVEGKLKPPIQPDPAPIVPIAGHSAAGAGHSAAGAGFTAMGAALAAAGASSATNTRPRRG